MLLIRAKRQTFRDYFICCFDQNDFVVVPFCNAEEPNNAEVLLAAFLIFSVTYLLSFIQVHVPINSSRPIVRGEREGASRILYPCCSPLVT